MGEPDDKAHVIEPENCIDCHICEDVCPTHAVHLVAA
ncbi:4Fe-4S binding protein [uncultured Adlercreutzia sp.]